MTIDKLKIEHGEIVVDYSGLSESFRIATMDEAKASLYMAAADVAVIARAALGIVVERAGFVAIAFAHGDKPGTRLILSIPTVTGDPAKIACPKIDAFPVIDSETGEILIDNPRNIYNQAVERLEAEIVEFVKGKRLQMALPFDETPEERALSAEGERILEFGRSSP